MLKSFQVKVLLLLITILFSCLSALAQGSGKISGTVKDQNDAVVLGATVTALNIASSQRTNVSTDSNGKYEFNGLRPGTYRVVVSSGGFGESAETVVLEDGGNITQDFSLSPGGIKDVVTVTAGKGADRLAVEIPQTVTVTSADQIEQRLPKSTFEAMERAPNLGNIETNPARERPRLRGLSSTRLLVVIDGEKLNNSRSDPGASGAPIAVVDPSSLQSIEVVAGSGSSLYGSDSIGGTINLVTKVPERSETGINTSLRFDGNYSTNGALRRGNLAFNLGTKQFAMRASGRAYRNANYNMGGSEVTIGEVINVGNFFRKFPTNAAGTAFQFAEHYPIYSLAKNQEIYNGQGSGYGTQIDGWFYPTDNHNIRGRYLNSDDGNNGNAFSGPPYETQERYGSFRGFSKWGIRYEGIDLFKYVPRVSANYFYQKLSFPQNQYTFNNVPFSSTTAGVVTSPLASYSVAGAAGVFTGLPSIFSAGSYTDNRNTISTDGMDLQAILAPFSGLFITVGGGKTTDNSRDSFLSTRFTGFGTARVLTTTTGIGASSPVTKYTDKNFYAQAEFDRVKWFRISAGIRYDNWITEAQPGNGFPLSTEFATLNAATPGLTASPGAYSSLVSALPSLVALAGGSGASGSDSKSTTYNFGIVGRLPFGINPYFRWATSYREPGITERFLIRNFTPGVPGLASLVVGNPNLKPEKGKNYDVGIKIAQKYFNFSLGYFHNDITDLLVFGPAQTYCVAPVPGAPGGFAGGCGTVVGATLGVQINARINSAAAVIKGWESTAEASIPLGSLGSFNPFYTLGALHGTNKNPTAVEIAQFNALYNRTDTLIPLTGSLSDFPLANITPFRIIYGGQLLNQSGRLFLEYNVRHQSRVTRAAPGQFVGTALINHGSFASMNSFNKHAIKTGYNWKTDKFKFSVNAGIDNIRNTTYWEHFQTAPAPGRSFVFGFTTEIFNLFKK
ncbi:MAG: TonB-dependent receptor [Pyrinomonadaceae bacterium]|jgi:outer membrane receptor protein involved in Fe transport|nr:TonB-dependent receptor [Pyrinomonadaceae bacterium]